MVEQTAEDWSNYWQGRASAASGAALAGAGVEDLPSLNAFWSSIFEEGERSAKVLDLACGAGSVIKHAAKAGFSDLHGSDISTGAIDALKARYEFVECTVASADNTPYDDNNFDMVVSQYGIEYADFSKTADEIIRLLNDGGQFVSINHFKGGAIENEVTENRQNAEKIVDSGFMKAAIDLITEEFASDHSGDINKEGYEKAKRLLVDAVPNDPSGLAQHLHLGFSQLYQRRQAYDLADITGWLAGMQKEIDAFIGRMKSMEEAALDEAQVTAFLDKFRQAGFRETSAEPFLLKTGEAPGAWVIRAKR